MYNIKISEPKSKKEFDAYYLLRWKILRKPWNQPFGSEKDDKELDAVHLIAILGNRVVGVARGHFNSKDQAQIRYMAVDNSFQNRGIGRELLMQLEEKLKEKGAREIILKAREKAVSLYEKQGFEIFAEGEVLFGEIAHFWMRKKIQS
jgi:ribosomal protein S18 acetylase RimI-like enzyme